MFDDGLLGGRIACDAVGAGRGAGRGAGLIVVGSDVGVGVAGRAASSSVTPAAEGGVVSATAGGEVVGGADVCGCRKATGGRESAEPTEDPVAEKAGAGAGPGRAAVVPEVATAMATNATGPTSTDVPATGRRSRTRKRVSQLDTRWFSAARGSPLKTSPSVVAGAAAFRPES